MTTPVAVERDDEARGALEMRSITKRYGAVLAVDDVSLTLPAGSFFSLLGPSGCGKTTLLRIIAGLQQPDVGGVLIDELDITSRPPERRPFNMVFQHYALFPHLSVFDNVAFGLTTMRSERPHKDEIARRVRQMLDLVGLSEYGRRWPAELSGGQKQRVALARALVRRPRVLLLDEPMAALDRNVRHQVREELLRIHNEIGTTFLLVTHDQDEALSISGLVGLMNLGRLEQVATPQVLYHRPATLFAARFVGAGSFLEGRAIRRFGNDVEVEVGSLRFASSNAGAAEGHGATVLLRPEDLTIVTPEAGRVTGSVETCTFFGSYFELKLQTPIGVIRARDRNPAEPGGVIGVSWPDVAGIAYPSPDGNATLAEGAAI